MKKLLLIVALGLLFFALGRLSNHESGSAASTAESPVSPATESTGNGDGAGSIADAYTRRLQDVQVQAEGRVVKLLPDDNQGSRHQRFLLDTGHGHTVLIAHNIDLAPRIDALQQGDRVAFKGEYVWNAKGGVVHWTHRDPGGRHPGGWLRHAGRTYE